MLNYSKNKIFIFILLSILTLVLAYTFIIKTSVSIGNFIVDEYELNKIILDGSHGWMKEQIKEDLNLADKNNINFSKVTETYNYLKDIGFDDLGPATVDGHWWGVVVVTLL